ncbi:hypothetical protein PCANC_13911 [Puccinia coronata f. sp. avenae]|uniref:OPT family small oligopeptide transporter n=1 Tax=Puccinia coronata f. sp. avenae TaxID=200324 RepID=A0A2N5SUL5_9BASI|nr:hypothetical protein PCANC_13911 [Puccinia coronata f. sp. avenae]
MIEDIHNLNFEPMTKVTTYEDTADITSTGDKELVVDPLGLFELDYVTFQVAYPVRLLSILHLGPWGYFGLGSSSTYIYLHIQKLITSSADIGFGGQSPGACSTLLLQSGISIWVDCELGSFALQLPPSHPPLCTARETSSCTTKHLSITNQAPRVLFQTVYLKTTLKTKSIYPNFRRVSMANLPKDYAAQNQSTETALRQRSTVPYVLNESANSYTENGQKPPSSVKKTDLREDIWKEQASEPEDLESVIRYLQQVIVDNQDDLNFPGHLLDRAAEALQPGVPAETVLETTSAIRAELKLAEENSPYPEVRAIVDAFDDPTTPVTTFRMWTIGIFLVFLGTGLNQFFAPRLPSISLSITFAQLVAYPLGCLMARFLPTRRFRIAGYEFSLNPGPFNMKEHMLISIMANVSFGGAYVTEIIAVLRIPRFYHNEVIGNNIGFQLTMALSSQMIGYTLAGLTREFLVYPPAMVWWGNLTEISVLRALHVKDNQPANGWKISQMRFFTFCTIAYGIYFILPDVFFQTLSFFNWTTWIAPNNVKLAMITGTVSGLGLNPFPTLDWNFMSLNPVTTPLWSIMNMYGGALAAFAAICGLFFGDVAYTQYLPINSNGIFDRFGKRYNASRILNSVGDLDQAKYEAYSPPYMTSASIISFTAFFGLYTSTVVHSILFYRKHLAGGFSLFWRQLIVNLSDLPIISRLVNPSEEKLRRTNQVLTDKYASDVHCRLMSVYPEVPQWWFMIIGIIATGMSIFSIVYYETQMPVWGLVFAFAIALVLIVPTGIVSAVASTGAPLNVISELVGGYALEGKPLANMLFKTYGYITTAQAISYASDLKLAHYVKIPPRATFAAQMVGTVLAAFISVAVLDWQIGQFPDLCSPTQELHFTCPGYNTFFSSSIIWGAVGPLRLFSKSGALYSFCMYGFALGAVAPIIPWLALKKWPRSGWRLIHTPVMFVGALSFAPLNLAYLTPAIPLGFFFQRYLKFRYTAWYEKYALTLTAGLGAGVALFGLVYFFAFQFNGNEWKWIGNTKFSDGCDGRYIDTLVIPDEAPNGSQKDPWNGMKEEI